MQKSDIPNRSAQLRALADLLDAHPDIPTPAAIPSHGLVSWHLWEWEYPDVRAAAADLRRTLGGKWEKSYSGDDLVLKREIDGVTYSIQTRRESVCARVVTGTETVTLPAVEAQPERTIEREIVEWDCAPLLEEAVSA